VWHYRSDLHFSCVAILVTGNTVIDALLGAGEA